MFVYVAKAICRSSRLGPGVSYRCIEAHTVLYWNWYHVAHHFCVLDVVLSFQRSKSRSDQSGSQHDLLSNFNVKLRMRILVEENEKMHAGNQYPSSLALYRLRPLTWSTSGFPIQLAAWMELWYRHHVVTSSVVPRHDPPSINADNQFCACVMLTTNWT